MAVPPRSVPLFLAMLRGGEIVWKNGRRMHLPGRYWFMLPTFCKLYKLGADLRWRENDLEVLFNDLIFVSPPDNRLLPIELDGILQKDHWRIRERPLRGKTVADIGSHIGVFAVACAKEGARVHAFEPFAGFRKYIDMNKSSNFVEDRIVTHPVGLSNRDEWICSSHDLASMASYTHGKEMIASEQNVQVVEAISYFRAKAITDVELMKMNCEGCEYDLITPQFLEAVNPKRISLEFHNGVADLADILKQRGMTVEGDIFKQQGKGNLFARKTNDP